MPRAASNAELIALCFVFVYLLAMSRSDRQHG